MDHPTALFFMLIVHNLLQLSGSAATPPAVASLSSAASCRACGGAGYSKVRSFTSGVSNPSHQEDLGWAGGSCHAHPLCLHHPEREKKKDRRITLILSSEQRWNTGGLELSHLFSGSDAPEVVNPASKYHQTGCELRNTIKITQQIQFLWVAIQPPAFLSFLCKRIHSWIWSVIWCNKCHVTNKNICSSSCFSFFF